MPPVRDLQAFLMFPNITRGFIKSLKPHKVRSTALRIDIPAESSLSTLFLHIDVQCHILRRFCSCLRPKVLRQRTSNTKLEYRPHF